MNKDDQRQTLEENMKHRIGMELRNSLEKMPLIQQSIISAFRQLSHTPKYFGHCFIHLQFIREKYVMFRIPSLADQRQAGDDDGTALGMNTITSYESPLNTNSKVDDNYRGFDWNVFWIHHLLVFFKTIFRNISTFERKQRILKFSSNSGTDNVEKES
ncbi:hypothetical protein RFI_35848, partial [Reticulomyxa filosa]